MRNPTKSLSLPLLISLLAGCAASSVDDSRSVVATDSVPVERLFLQQVTHNSAIVKWRGAAEEACYSDHADGLSDPATRQCVAAENTDGNGVMVVRVRGQVG